MRLDKYLKVSWLIRRRTLVKEVSDQDRITIDGNAAKTGSDVKVEDALTVCFGQKLVTVKVTALNEHASEDNAKGMYEIVEERRLEEAQVGGDKQ